MDVEEYCFLVKLLFCEVLSCSILRYLGMCLFSKVCYLSYLMLICLVSIVYV